VILRALGDREVQQRLAPVEPAIERLGLAGEELLELRETTATRASIRRASCSFS
jgi:hypothetical protein